MKIWVVVGFFQYEGYFEPEKAFSSEEKAKAYVKSMKRKDPKRFDSIDIFELTVE